MKSILFLVLCLTLTVVCRAEEGEEDGKHKDWKEIKKAICDPTKVDDKMMNDMNQCTGGMGGNFGDSIKTILDECNKKHPDELAKFANVKEPENQGALMFKCMKSFSSDFKDCLKEGFKGQGGGKKGGKKGDRPQLTDEQKKNLPCCLKKAAKVDAPDCPA